MSTKMIVLKSSDGFTFEIEEAAAKRSHQLAHMIEDGCDNNIPVPNVKGMILALVTEYCKKHPVVKAKPTSVDADNPNSDDDAKPTSVDDANPTLVDDAKPTSDDDANPTSVDDANPTLVDDANPTSEEDLKKWDEQFLLEIDLSTLFDLILAANHLCIDSLIDLACQAVADTIKDKNPDQIRKEFNIKADYTPAEENDILEKNKWAFE